MTRIIALCNQKGGVGKTTSAVNIAAYLAAAERKTLLIDLDPQGNATSGIGIDKTTIRSSIYPVLLRDRDINKAILPTLLPSLSLIPSNVDLAGAEVELMQSVSRETRLKEVLQRIETEYDFILIDNPPSLGLLTLNSLTAATDVLIPVQCEYYALEGIASLRQTIQLVQENLNPNLNILGIFLSMFDPRNNLSHQVAREVKEFFKELVFKTIIPRNVRLSEAPSYGKPILLYDVKSKGAHAYLELTQELLKRCESDNISERDPSPLVQDDIKMDRDDRVIKSVG